MTTGSCATCSILTFRKIKGSHGILASRWMTHAHPGSSSITARKSIPQKPQGPLWLTNAISNILLPSNMTLPTSTWAPHVKERVWAETHVCSKGNIALSARATRLISHGNHHAGSNGTSSWASTTSHPSSPHRMGTGTPLSQRSTVEPTPSQQRLTMISDVSSTLGTHISRLNGYNTASRTFVHTGCIEGNATVPQTQPHLTSWILRHLSLIHI